MSLNSVNTNMGAMIALNSLNQTNSQLASVQKQISTGYRVSDASDDGAAFAIAQRVRSDVGALTTANQQLGGVQGLLQTTTAGLTNVSNQMSNMRQVLTNLASGNTVGDARTQDVSNYNSMLAQLKTDISDAAYSGKTLIGNIGSGASGFGAVNVVRNEVGSTYGIGTFSGAALYSSLTISSSITAGAAAALITGGGTFLAQFSSVGSQLNAYGAATNYVTSQVSYNNNKIDALNGGLGSLIDADLAKESAQLQALQIRQQLGTQSLSIANQAPQSLLSLFK